MAWRSLTPLGVLLLAGCAADLPPGQRGFFEAMGAAASGEDVRRDARLQQDAALAEQRAAEMRARLDAAQREASASGAAVETAQARLRRLEAEIATLRRRAEALPRDGSPDADRMRRQAEALERERRAAVAAPGGPSEAAVDRVQDRARALDQALDRQRRM